MHEFDGAATTFMQFASITNLEILREAVQQGGCCNRAGRSGDYDERCFFDCSGEDRKDVLQLSTQCQDQGRTCRLNH